MEGSGTFNIDIPENVEKTIRLLCNEVHTIEWSGVLFYTVEGSFDDGSLKIKCLDILVMDIGVSTYTEFNDNPDVVSYRIDHPELLQPNVYEGLIHSHNNMASFFSGTDTDTLREEGSNCNHFLSLIVNNAGQYVARITRKLHTKVTIKAHVNTVESTSYNTYGNALITLKENEPKEEDIIQEKEEDIVEWYDLKINKPEVEDSDKELRDRISELREKKSKNVSSGFKIDIPTPKAGYQVGYTADLHKNKTSRTTLVKTPEKNKKIKGDQPHVYRSNPVTLSGEEKDFFDVVACIGEDEVLTMCAKLLTGNIFAECDSTVDLASGVKGLTADYIHLIGDSDQNIEDFISNYLDIIINSSITQDMWDICMSVDNDIDPQAVCAYLMMQTLKPYEYEDIVKTMNKELLTYLPQCIKQLVNTQII